MSESIQVRLLKAAEGKANSWGPYGIDPKETLEREAADYIDRLEDTLRFYADLYKYLHEDGECPPICSDEGQRARKALEK